MMLVGCTTQPRQAQPVAKTADGQIVQRFTLTRANALGITPISNAAITARAAEVCPNGYREVSRRAQADRRISGVIYTDVTVDLICG